MSHCRLLVVSSCLTFSLLGSFLAQHPGEGVATVAKALGHLWSSLTAEDKQVYQEKAAEERARLAAELKAWEEAGGLETLPNDASKPVTKSATSLIFPVARIRKICKLDPDVKGLSKEALLLVTKAAELVVQKLGKETVKVAQVQNRRKLQSDDVSQVCAIREQFVFLRDDVADLTKLQKQRKEKEQASNKKADEGDETAESNATKPMTAYFSAKPKAT